MDENKYRRDKITLRALVGRTERLIISHEVLNPLVPCNPRSDSLPVNPKRYCKHADGKETGTKNVENG